MNTMPLREEQIIQLLDSDNIDLTTDEVERKYGFCPNIYQRWKAKFGNLSISTLKKFNQHDTQNRELLEKYNNACREKKSFQDVIDIKFSEPSSRKALAHHAVEKYHISVRHACMLFRLSRTTYYYVGKKKQDDNLVNRLLELAREHPSNGYWKLYYLLRDEGFLVNHKRVYRLYKKYGLEIKKYNKTRETSIIDLPIDPM